MKKYQVIGGQYEKSWKGESDSLRGAKIISKKNIEYWDNWQGWHTPNIYRAEDCEEREANGELTLKCGTHIFHKIDAEPIL